MIKIGENLKKEENVQIGYIVDRKMESDDLLIGENANIRSNSILYLGSKIGNNLTTGHNVIIREENEIGEDFSIWSNSVVDYGCKIGNGVKIHTNCYIAQYTTIEDGVFIAPGVSIANDFHPGCDKSKECMKGPIIGENTQVGVNVTILPYVKIGQNCLIGAGSVITKDIPDNSVVYGNPGVVVKTVDELKCKTGKSEKPY